MEAISTGSTLGPVFARGEGCWLFDKGGRRFFDGTSGSGALSLGHRHPAVLEAVRAQLERLVHTGCKLKSDVRERLAERICALAPFPGAAALFTVIGAEAVEAALKVARASTGRRGLVCFRHAYHGKTAGALSLTWRREFRPYSELPAANVIEAGYPSHEGLGEGASVEAHLDAFADALHGAEREGNPVAAVVLEPVQVTEGLHAPGLRFLEGVIETSHRAGALVVFDEIYTGLGRCGRPFYCQGMEAKPDLLLVGKSLGNGFPISMVVGPAAIINALPAGVQTSTFSGHPVSCAAGLAVLDVVEERALWREAEAGGTRLLAGLRALEPETGFMRGSRGVGMLAAFDCLDDSGRPSPVSARRFQREALAEGLLLFGGGRNDATIKVVPPVLMDSVEEAFLISALRKAALRTSMGGPDVV